MKKVKTISNDKARQLKRRLNYIDKIIISFAIESGMRISDILNLRRGDIKKTMTIHESKSKRERTFVISDSLLKKLKESTAFKTNSDFVFDSVHSDAKTLHRSTIYRRIKKALRGLNFDCTAHSMRKLYAQNILNETGSIEAVQKSLNHKSILTTATYLDIDIEKLIKEVKRI